MKVRKWIPRSRMAIYVGTSQQHATSVGLLLSLTTGLVSPQFHVRYDNTFETVTNGQKGVRSKWQLNAGFKGVRESITPLTADNLQENTNILSAHYLFDKLV